MPRRELEVDLTTVAGLEAAMEFTYSPSNAVGMTGVRSGTPNGTYCPTCGDTRRMSIDVRSAGRRSTGARVTLGGADPVLWTDPRLLPALVLLTCVQCSGRLAVMVYEGPRGVEAVALPSSYGGLSTPETPEAVAYYLDQAQRSQAVGAVSAAVAMYRAALEQLLFDQGFSGGMLNRKIGDLEKSPDPPEWFRDLDSEFLRVMKDLGNGAIHPNGGDVDKQQAFDKNVLAEVRALFIEILDDVYEQPARRAARLATLRLARDRVEE